MFAIFLENPEEINPNWFVALWIETKKTLRTNFHGKNRWTFQAFIKAKTTLDLRNNWTQTHHRPRNNHAETSKVNELFCLTYFNSICSFTSSLSLLFAHSNPFARSLQTWICTVSVIKRFPTATCPKAFSTIFASSRGWNFAALKKNIHGQKLKVVLHESICETSTFTLFDVCRTYLSDIEFVITPDLPKWKSWPQDEIEKKNTRTNQRSHVFWSILNEHIAWRTRVQAYICDYQQKSTNEREKKFNFR